MVYNEQVWQDGEAGGTPLSAARLNHMESGIDAAHNEVDARGQIGYAQVTASQAGITTEVDLSGLAVTVDVPAGRQIRITGRVQWTGDGTNNARGELRIYEDATVLQTNRKPVTAAAYGLVISVLDDVIVTPTGGSHTYKLTGAAAATVGSISMGAAAGVPAFILVEDLGPA